MDSVECIVIGAGVVGLATARALVRQGRDVLVLERNDGFGRETSSRNSEVIHAGMHYPAGSLKALLCVRGSRQLYELCAARGIAHKRTGKLIVAADEREAAGLEALRRQGEENGVPDLRMLSGLEAREREPRVSCVAALFSGSTGIVDSHGLMGCLAREVESAGGVVAYNCAVTAVERCVDGFRLAVREPGGGESAVCCPILVNAAGLSSERLAAMAGIDVDAAGYRLRPCKGEYFRLSGRYRSAFGHLVYPPPECAGLGIHVVLGLDGSVRLGPNARYVSSIDYTVDPGHAGEFLDGARRYLPSLQPEDLSPDIAGIRPKLQGPGEAFRDFVIREEGDRGLPGLVDLIGIESPGLTACLAIGEKVGEILGGKAYTP